MVTDCFTKKIHVVFASRCKHCSYINSSVNIFKYSLKIIVCYGVLISRLIKRE